MSLKMISGLLYRIETVKSSLYWIKEEEMKELRIERVENNQGANTVGKNTGQYR